ncbi:MAG: V-type ATP synthase subunit D [Candidatus Hadarchaeales archaeon]
MMSLSPTRMELLRLRRRIALARKGHDLLREKMDALVMEFFEVLRKIYEKRERAFEQLEKAHSSLSLCMASWGTAETEQAAREARKGVAVETSLRYIMGVPVPVVEVGETARTALDRGYSLHPSPSLLDRASEEFERALKMLAELAELEEAARALAWELERTRRRVNALEYILIPRLEASLKFIGMRLDEMEREHFFRLKRIKATLERREAGGGGAEG